MIDYFKIANALSYYQGIGYIPLDASWFASRKAMEVTAPPGCRYCSCFLGDLVASGEQSFIQMWMDGKLKKGKWQCATPCFRDEQVVDELHLNYFFKVELIDVLPCDVQWSISCMVGDALSFFKKYDIKVEVIDTDIGIDIVAKGIELGSYGYREYGDFKWVYGTGIAEPRLSHVVKTKV